MNKEILKVDKLKVNLRLGKRELTAINEVSFSVNEGEILGIVGESGCGKSMTATAIMHLFQGDTGYIAGGDVLLKEESIRDKTEKEMRKVCGKEISMIFQEPMTSLNPVHTIGRQLSEMIRAHQKIGRKASLKIAVQLLRDVGMPLPEQRIREYPHQLSGGMRQRVMIAMALSCNPCLLIADEPTTALDVTIQAQILELMKEIQKEKSTAILLITHDMGVVAETADHVLVMYAGEDVEYGTVEHIFEKPLHPYTRGLLGSIPQVDSNVDRLATISGNVPELADMPKGCRFCMRCGSAMEKCRTAPPPVFQPEGNSRVRCWIYEGGVME